MANLIDGRVTQAGIFSTSTTFAARSSYIFAQLQLAQPYDNIAAVVVYTGATVTADLTKSANLSIWLSQSVDFINAPNALQCGGIIRPTTPQPSANTRSGSRWGWRQFVRCSFTLPAAQYVSVVYLRATSTQFSLHEVQVMLDKPAGIPCGTCSVVPFIGYTSFPTAFATAQTLPALQDGLRVTSGSAIVLASGTTGTLYMQAELEGVIGQVVVRTGHRLLSIVVACAHTVCSFSLGKHVI